MMSDQFIAYIDPSSGTILLQALIAGALGIVWRITSLFRRRRQPTDQPVVETVVMSESAESGSRAA